MTDPGDFSLLLHNAGRRMCADSAQARHLPKDRRIFLHSWGRKLQASGMWVAAQTASGVLGPEDIVSIVQLDIDTARTYMSASQGVPSPA